MSPISGSRSGLPPVMVWACDCRFVTRSITGPTVKLRVVNSSLTFGARMSRERVARSRIQSMGV